MSLLHYTNRILSFWCCMCATYRICLENTLHFCFYIFFFLLFFCKACLSYCCYVLILQQITFTFSLLQFHLFLCVWLYPTLIKIAKTYTWTVLLDIWVETGGSRWSEMQVVTWKMTASSSLPLVQQLPLSISLLSFHHSISTFTWIFPRNSNLKVTFNSSIRWLSYPTPHAHWRASLSLC